MIKDFGNSPILITGVQRSGTSIIARIISSCGAFEGRTNNMFENNYFNSLIDQYYTEAGVSVKGQFPLLNTKNLVIPKDWKCLVENGLFKDNYDFNKPWMCKSFRLCQMWPVWHEIYPNAKWIIVRRRTGDIISSCMKTGFMDAFKTKKKQQLIGVSTEQEGWKWFVQEHHKRFVEMIEAGVNIKVIWPERMVYGDYQQIEEMLEWLGLPYKESIKVMTNTLLWNSPQMKERSK